MKTFLIITLLSLAFTACSTKNAFSSLDLSPYQEKSEENTQSSKIKDSENIDGLVTAIYLNALESETYADKEYFYIYLYTKSENRVVFMLNDKKAMKVEELQANNIFSHLNTFNSEWSRYYLVSFTNVKEDENLSLQIHNANFSSGQMLFEKPEEE